MTVETHLTLGVNLLGLPFWLSVATWVLAGLIFLAARPMPRSMLRRAQDGIG